MQQVEIRVHVEAPVERVFDAMADHERFIRDRLTNTRLIRTGAPERDGLGARREVRAPPVIRFVEEITAWQRPSSYEYLIVETSLPMKHHGGRMSFAPSGAGTDVAWTTRFEIPIAIAGTVMEPIVKRVLVSAFRRYLDAVKRRLEG